MRIIRAIFPVLAAVALATMSGAPSAQVLVRIDVAPPPLPVYVQPAIPGPDYIWVPGYWAWGPAGYFWVPGTWVLAPAPGLLWTPGYWAWYDGAYVWHAGYWGPHVGFYGGINYGCGYTGIGYQGGYWSGGVFMYNRAVVNVGAIRITNVYYKAVGGGSATNTSFNGGRNGTQARPNPQELAAANERHVPATNLQTQHEHAAGNNNALLASVNHGTPGIAATPIAGHFSGHGVAAAKVLGALVRSPNRGNMASTVQQRPLQVRRSQFAGQGLVAKGFNARPQAVHPVRMGGQANVRGQPHKPGQR
jgi:hypothetical protein